MLNHTATLYLATIFIWGSTWFTYRYQIVEGSLLWPIALRFFLASIVMIALCKIKHFSLRLSRQEYQLLALQGVFLFFLNYWFLYQATQVIASGLVAVIFSLISVVNIINARIFLGKSMQIRSILGSLIGLVGIIVVFQPYIELEENQQFMWNIILCFVGTYVASLGNIISVKLQESYKTPIMSGSAVAMLFGSICCISMSLLLNERQSIPDNIEFWGGLIYLVIFGTVIGFYSYFTLLGRLGSDRAAYAMVLFPIVAVVFSVIFEDLQIYDSLFVGLAIVIIGNIILLLPKRLFTIKQTSPE